MTNQEKKECVAMFEKWNSRIDTCINGELSEYANITIRFLKKEPVNH
jgi:hypothetical protein